MRRILHLTLAALLMSTLCTGVAVAGQPPAPLPPPSGDYPASLATRIAAINQQLAELPQREAELTAQQKALDGRVDSYNQRSRDVLAQLDAVSRRIDDHNATVASYPNGAPPAIADALNAEAANLNAENQNLKTEAGKIAAEGDDIKTKQAQLAQQQRDLERQRNALPAELQRLLQQAASALQALAQALPSTVGQAPGGDPSRPSSPPGVHPYDAGGDPASRTNLGAALDGYAKDHGVQVDKRPGIASLTPQSVAKLPASQLSQLQLLRAFDGVVGKPNGNYKALYVTPPRQQPTAAQKAFSDALEQGGTATAVRDGNTITIDEIEQVVDDPTTCPPSNSFTAGTQVLLADGSTRPIEQVTTGLQVRATDPITGRTTSEPVLAQITSTGPKQLDRLFITNGDHAAGTVTATAGHRIWDPDRHLWVAAGDLRPDNAVASLPGITVRVTGNLQYRALATVYNLTVADLHTYYVLAGNIPILVHNDDCYSQMRDELASRGLRVTKATESELELSIQDAQDEKGTWLALMDNSSVLELAVDVKESPIRGYELFNLTMKYFGDKVKGLRGNWVDVPGLRDNLDRFNWLIREGKSLEDAARGTPTGKWAGRYGFTHVQPIVPPVGSPGEYTHAEFLFY